MKLTCLLLVSQVAIHIMFFRLQPSQTFGPPLNQQTETVHQPPVPGKIYPPYTNYPNVAYVLLPTMLTMTSASVHLNSLIIYAST